MFITKGTKVVYEAEEDTEFIYITYPHWMDAQLNSTHADMLKDFPPVVGEMKLVSADRNIPPLL